MNWNVSASLNVFRLLARPELCLPHAVVPTFNDLPIPLDQAFQPKTAATAATAATATAKSAPENVPDIRAVVLDKDDCFAYPESNQVFPEYRAHFKKLRQAYPGRRLLIVSNTAGANSHDRSGGLAAAVERATADASQDEAKNGMENHAKDGTNGLRNSVPVLRHATKKPGCGDEILAYFRQHPETGVQGAHQIAVVGDRLATDMLLANRMGGWSVWVRDGVVPLKEKSLFSRIERRLAGYLMARGYSAPRPQSPFEE